MKTMRRSIAWLLLTAVLLSLASCKKEKKPSTPVSSTVSTPTAASSGIDLPSFVDTDIDDTHNLARQGTAVADSVSSDYPTYTPDKMTDGDMLTRWLSGREGTPDDPSTFGIDWEEEKTFDTVMIYWEAAHPTEDGYLVQTDFPEPTEEPTGDASSEAVESGDADEKLPYRIVRRYPTHDDGQVDVILFDTPVTADWLRITCTKPYFSETYHEQKKCPSCYELEVYYSAEVDGVVSADTGDVTAAEESEG